MAGGEETVLYFGMGNGDEELSLKHPCPKGLSSFNARSYPAHRAVKLWGVLCSIFDILILVSHLDSFLFHQTQMWS